MHLFLAAEDSGDWLKSELSATFPGASLKELSPSLFRVDATLPVASAWPHVVFALQCFPGAEAAQSASINGWANLLFERVVQNLPEGKPWRLLVAPAYEGREVHRIGARAWHSSKRVGRADVDPRSDETGASRLAAGAGAHRCRLIREELIGLLRKKRRHLLRGLSAEPGAFAPETSLVQLVLTTPATGFLSVALAPLPYAQRHLLSPFPNGEIEIAGDRSAPSRAFAKLLEAELRLGCRIDSGETCIDLGAAPGSWTYVAANRGACVLAVDRAGLRADLMGHPKVEFVPADAFRYQPTRPVDWLLCDVIAPGEKSARLLIEWLRRGWCRRFVVTIKLKDENALEVLRPIKRELPPLASHLCLTHLCANKKEACAFGIAAPLS
jgi:23S rRNA (cytidine2498-2'-O)-methyltransferase